MRASIASTSSSYAGASPSKTRTPATCMCAPLRSRCRKPASRAVRRSRLGTARSSHVGVAATTLHRLCKVCAQIMKSAMTLSDPAAFERAYDQHARSVYRAAYRVLGSTAQAQDVVQDVFLKLWRDPGKFDARRGELGSYLRVMARSRALDTWREVQAAGRAS